jgi:hypothetical protein
MDIWEETTNRVKQAVLAEEPEAALAGALELFANFGRTLEMISGDMDRIATALEGNIPAPGIGAQVPEAVHDL